MLMTPQDSKQTHLECETFYRTTNPVSLQQVKPCKLKKKKEGGEEKCSRLKDTSPDNQI